MSLPSSPNRDALKKYFEKLTHEELIDKCVGIALHAHNVEKMADERIHSHNAILAQLSAECESVHKRLAIFNANEHLPGAVASNYEALMPPIGMMSGAATMAHNVAKARRPVNTKRAKSRKKK